MKDTFRAIQFNRKQRIAFILILVLILMGSLINIKGFSSDKEKMAEYINLDEVITQAYYYKKYYKSKYRKSSSSGKNKSSLPSKNKTSSKNESKTQQMNQDIGPVSNSRVKQKAIDTFIQVMVPEDYAIEKVDLESSEKKQDEAFQLNNFDPNIATKDDLMLMYLPEKWINNVIAFRTKGGVYRKKEDLKKLYTTTDALFAEIETYVIISDSAIAILEEKQAQDKDAANQAWLEELVTTSQRLEINSINQETLIKLPKVTPSLARKISKYRQILGGYHQLEQLLEVYDLDQSIYDDIIPYLKCDNVVEYLNVNATESDKLNKHPYIGYKKAKVILRYRKQHGLFESVDQVQKVGIWNSKEFALLKPYLTVGY